MINQRRSTYPSREPVQTNRATSNTLKRERACGAYGRAVAQEKAQRDHGRDACTFDDDAPVFGLPANSS